jgi:hypothetical protein
MSVNETDLEARFGKVESLIKTENAELKQGFERLEAGQSRLELLQLALESQQGQLEKSQKVLLGVVRLLASEGERSRMRRTCGT